MNYLKEVSTLLSERKYDLIDVWNFISAHILFYYNKIIGLPSHVIEQINHRYNVCSDDCLIEERCVNCTCHFGSANGHVGKEYQVPPCSGLRYPRLYFSKDKYNEAIENGEFNV